MRERYDEYHLQSAMDEMQEQLGSIVDQERQTLEELDQAGQGHPGARNSFSTTAGQPAKRSSSSPPTASRTPTPRKSFSSC